MYPDNDIKIAGDKPSQDIKNMKKQPLEKEHSGAEAAAAKEFGRLVALEFIKNTLENEDMEEAADYEMLIQRRLLLSFTATAGFEQYCQDDALCGRAQKSFFDTVKKNSDELYKASGDTGAFSFYYLAYRRGGDTERRMGQTFAMLCAHDGDPIYQELGEALYCWFLAAVKKAAQKTGFVK